MSVRTRMTILVVACVAWSSIASPLDRAVVQAASPSAEAASAPVRVSMIGDSTLAALEWYSSSSFDILGIVGQSYPLTFDAASCRRLVVPSCRGRSGSQPLSVLPLMRSTLNGRLGDVMVVMAGYDDYTITSAIEQVMDEAISQGVDRVLWLDYRTTTTYVLPGGGQASAIYASNNRDLATVAARRGDLQILDWSNYSAHQPTWFAGDGIHLTPTGAAAVARYVKAALDVLPPIGRCRASSAVRGTADEAVGVPSVPSGRFGFVPLTPRRVLDTRQSVDGLRADKLGVGRTLSIDLSTFVPSDAGAAALSVTAVDSCTAGYLTVYACGARPPTSNINFAAGATTAGLAITPMSDGLACIFSSSATDLVVDVVGAFTPDGDPFHPLVPTRWVDTRGGGAAQLPLIIGERGANVETEIALRGIGGVPADATAVWLNLTIADPVAGTVLAAYPGPCGSPLLVSNVNARRQQSTASAVLVGIGTNGSVCVRTHSGGSHIVVDVAGWFGPGAGGLLYEARDPVRLLDARQRGTVTTAPQTVVISDVAVLNVTVTDAMVPGHVAVEPCSSNRISSLINTAASHATANVIAIGGDRNGFVCAAASVPAFLIIDQVAAFVP